MSVGARRISSPCEFVGPDLRCLRPGLRGRPLPGLRRLLVRRAPLAGRPLYCATCSGGVRTCACGRTFTPAGGGYARCHACPGPAAALPSLRPRADGPVRAVSLPASVYAAVRSSGPCVYCGSPATTVDHVWPRSRGGPEAESNLVPACWSRNPSKADRLLTGWHAPRVARAAPCSPVVTAELARLAAA